MAKSNSRRSIALNEKSDRISQLPQNLQESILNLLPVRDAVRTSVLAKKWRYSWTTIPNLVFDGKFILSFKRNPNHSRDPVIITYEFASLINKILLQHNGPLVKFAVPFPEDCDVGILSNYIDQWIPLLSKYGVKKLVIENWAYTGRNNTPISYDFHPGYFSGLKLTHLLLYGAKFHNTAAPVRFSHLTTLELVSCVNVEDKEWVLDCPILQNLTLKLCMGIFHTNFSAPKLNFLHFQSYEIRLEGLKTLQEFSFLLEVGSYAYEWTKNYTVAAILGTLQKIEKLSIGLTSIQHLAAGPIPLRLPERLIYLKSLDISNVDFTDLSQVLCILCILRSTPNLCNLKISALSFCDDIGEDVKSYRVEDPIECILNQLKIVTFNNFKGLKTERELMKFIFFHSPCLKKIFILPSSIMRRSATKEVAEEIQRYSFASKVAEIVLLKDYIYFFRKTKDYISLL